MAFISSCLTLAARGLGASLIFAILLAGVVGCGGAGVGSGLGPLEESPAVAPPGLTGFFSSTDAQLHYRLDLPSGPGPFPAVVFGHGSGQVTTADGAIHVPFWLGQGFAVLRFDKRGSGQSTGSYRGVSAANSAQQIPELAADMVAAMAFLRVRPDIDAARIGLTGVSQAGWVMLAATSLARDVSFVVALVGSAVPVGVNIAWEDLRLEPIEQAYAALAQYAGPTGWDPQPAVRASRAPVLYLLGAEDRLVPTRVCAQLVERLREQGAPVTARVYPGLGHALGSSSVTWPDIASWLRAQGVR